MAQKRRGPGNGAFGDGFFDFDVAVAGAFGFEVAKSGETLFERAAAGEGGACGAQSDASFEDVGVVAAFGGESSPQRKMWVWESIRPGRTVELERSMTLAPANLVGLPQKHFAIRLPRIRLILIAAARDLPSMRTPARMATSLWDG